jgi:hypothetical protein
LHPQVSGRFEFWGEPTLVKPLDIKEVRVVVARRRNQPGLVA